VELRFDNYILKAFLASGLLSLVSLIAILMQTLLSGGIIYGITTQRQSWEELLSGLAICMIVGMTLLSYLKRSLGEIEY
jgi:hypothetical protein